MVKNEMINYLSGNKTFMTLFVVTVLAVARFSRDDKRLLPQNLGMKGSIIATPFTLF